MSKLRFIQKCPRCAGMGVAERISGSDGQSLYSFLCQDCGFLAGREESKSLFDDAYSLYLKGYAEKCSCEEIFVEKEKVSIPVLRFVAYTALKGVGK